MNAARTDLDTECDVAVIGPGLGACVLAAALARGGLRTVLIGGPRTAPPFGEMLGRYAALLLEVIAERYGVPELTRLTLFDEANEVTGGACGAERCHGFVYHREGQAQNPAELTQLSPPRGVPPEPLLARPEADDYLWRVAVGHGAVPLRGEGAAVVAADTGGEGPSVTLAGGGRVRARFLVDASGRESVLAARVRAREEPARLVSRTRTIATRFTGVRDLAQAAGQPRAYKMPVPWGQGSTQHLFDGGYLWVFPFGNHPGARNRTTSVGLTLDADRFPEREPPQREFAAFLRRFPTLAAMFADAEPVQPWTSTGRQQYSSAVTAGDGWCLIGEAAGYVDPFLNRSLISTLEGVNALAWRLLAAGRDGDFSARRFTAVDRINQQVLAENDALVSMVLAATRDHALWKAVLLVLEAGLRYGQFPAQIALGTLRAGGGDGELRRLEEVPYFGSPFPGHEGYHRLFTAAAAQCAEVRSGHADPVAAAERIVAALREADFVPRFFGLSDPQRRVLRLNPVILLRMLLWARRSAPPDIGPLVRTAVATLARERRESKRRARRGRQAAPQRGQQAEQRAGDAQREAGKKTHREGV